MRTSVALVETITNAIDAVVTPRQMLNDIDTELATAIEVVERLLIEMKPGVPASVSYDTEDGRFLLHFEKHNGQWCIMHSTEADDDDGIMLRAAPRHVRAEVWAPSGDLDPPIVRLFPALVDSLKEIIASRRTALEVAEQVVRVLRPTIKGP